VEPSHKYLMPFILWLNEQNDIIKPTVENQ